MDTRMMRLWQLFDSGGADAASQSEVAQRLGVSRTTINRYYTGERAPRLIGYGKLWGAVMGMRNLDWKAWAEALIKALGVHTGADPRLEDLPDDARYAAASRRAMGAMFVAGGIEDGAILAQFMEVIP